MCDEHTQEDVEDDNFFESDSSMFFFIILNALCFVPVHAC